jgi:hypothetical protein
VSAKATNDSMVTFLRARTRVKGVPRAVGGWCAEDFWDPKSGSRFCK